MILTKIVWGSCNKYHYSYFIYKKKKPKIMETGLEPRTFGPKSLNPTSSCEGEGFSEPSQWKIQSILDSKFQSSSNVSPSFSLVLIIVTISLNNLLLALLANKLYYSLHSKICSHFYTTCCFCHPLHTHKGHEILAQVLFKWSPS